MLIRHLVPLILILSLGLAGGCATHPSPTQPVKIAQENDSQLSCQQLAEQINHLEKRIVEMIELHQQHANTRFTYAAALDTALTILSKGRAGAASHIDRSPIATMNEQEKQVIFSLQERHAHLMTLARQKQCAFVPKD